MLKKEQTEKILKAFNFMELRGKANKEILCIISKNESLADIREVIPDSNHTALYELNSQRNGDELVKKIADSLKDGNMVILALGDYLDPIVYNQLFLFSKEGRMFFGEEIFSDFPDSSGITIVISEENSEKLNYDNLFDICGIVVRL